LEDGNEILPIDMDFASFKFLADRFRHYRRSVKRSRGTWGVQKKDNAKVQCIMG
jgi:hypothetical protein